ncbi:MAG: hypothetical protein ABSF49_19130 [Roseiarcus sp.]
MGVLNLALGPEQPTAFHRLDFLARKQAERRVEKCVLGEVRAVEQSWHRSAAAHRDLGLRTHGWRIRASVEYIGSPERRESQGQTVNMLLSEKPRLTP